MELTPEMLKTLQRLVRASDKALRQGVRSKDITLGKEMVKVPVRAFNQLQSALHDVKDSLPSQWETLNLVPKGQSDEVRTE